MTPVASLVGSPRMVLAHAYVGGLVALVRIGETATTHLLAGSGANVNGGMWRPKRTMENPITWSRPTQLTGKPTSPGVEPVIFAWAGICVVVTARLCGSTMAATTSTSPGVVIVRSTVSAAAFWLFEGSWAIDWARRGVAGGLFERVRKSPAEPTRRAIAIKVATARAAGDLIGQIWWVRSFSKLGN